MMKPIGLLVTIPEAPVFRTADKRKEEENETTNFTVVAKLVREEIISAYH